MAKDMFIAYRENRNSLNHRVGVDTSYVTERALWVSHGGSGWMGEKADRDCSRSLSEHPSQEQTFPDRVRSGARCGASILISPELAEDDKIQE